MGISDTDFDSRTLRLQRQVDNQAHVISMLRTEIDIAQTFIASIRQYIPDHIEVPAPLEVATVKAINPMK